MPDMGVDIIEQIIQIRKEKGITQKELARAANLAQPAIARLESKAAVPQLDTLMKVAAALGCDLALVPVAE